MPCCDLRGFLCHVRDFRANGAGDLLRYETAATILGGGAAPEYIIIGLLSFLLGVCVTILCFRVHLLDKEEQAEQRGDRANGIDH